MLVRESGEVLAQVLEAYGVPVNLDRRPPLARTRLGAGVLAGARAALPDGTAADLLTWLRTPGRLADPDAADALETWVRRAEIRTAAEVRPRLADTAPLDALADAAAAGPEAFLDALAAEAHAIWTAPHRRAAAVLGPEDAADARAAAALRDAAAELRALAAADPALAGSPQELLAALGARAGARAGRRGGGAGRRPAGDPRPPLPRRVRVRAAGGRVPEPSGARAVPRRRRADLARPRERDRAAPPRGRAVARALPALRGGVAARGGAVPLVPRLRRGGRADAAVGVRRRRARAVHRRAVGAPRPPAARRGHVAARRGADPARAAPRARRRGGGAGAGAARRAGQRAGAGGPRRARDRGRARARGVRRLRRALADRQRAAPAAQPSRTPSRCAAGRSPTPCSSARSGTPGA